MRNVEQETKSSLTTIVSRTHNKQWAVYPGSREAKKLFSYIQGESEPGIIYEKQSETAGGLMIDLDMYFKKDKPVIKARHRKELCDMVANLFFESFECDRIHQAVIVKPLPVNTSGGKTRKHLPKDKDKGCYKDGFHILIPNILMTKDMRRFMLREIQQKMSSLKSWNSPRIKFALGGVQSVVDQASAWVGVHFIGCPSKPRSKPYTLENVFLYNRGRPGEPKDIRKRVQRDHNFVLEFSLRDWELETLVEKRELAFSEETRNKFGSYLDEIEARRREAAENDQKYAPTAEHLEEVADDELGFIGHLGSMLQSLPDEYARDGAQKGRKWQTVIACIKNIAEHYNLDSEGYRETIIDMLDLFSQRGGDSYRDRDDVEKNYESLPGFGYVGFLLYLVRENATQANQVICQFEEDFPKHARRDSHLKYVKGLDVKRVKMYEILYENMYNEELNDSVASAMFLVAIQRDLVVADDDGNGYMFSEDSNLWEEKTKKELARLVPKMLKEVMQRIRDRVRLTIEEAEGDLQKYHSQIFKSLIRFINYVCSANGMKNVFHIASTDLKDEKFAEKLNVKHHLFPTMDGNIVNLKTGKVRPRVREDMFSFACPVRYIENPNLVNVMRLVNSIFCDDVELIEYMRCRMGMFLTGDNSVREFDIWHGSGRNGKSTLCKMLGDILGSGQFYNSLSDGIFITNPKLSRAQKSEHTSHKVPLIGIRLGICQEIEKDAVLNAKEIKGLSAGDPFRCRGAYEKKEKECIPFCKLVLCVNPKPKFDVDDQAVIDRARYIPFLVRFVNKPDPKNKFERLADSDFVDSMMTQEERNNLFSWLVGGAVSFYTQGRKLVTPELVLEDKKKSINENDVVGQFVQECCDLYPTGEDADIPFARLSRAEKREWTVSLNDIKYRFSQWLDDDAAPPKRGTISQRLLKMGLQQKRSGGYKFLGIRFAYEEDSGSDSDSD
jgi:P4 family phage/plasmid primase-like protien